MYTNRDDYGPRPGTAQRVQLEYNIHHARILLTAGSFINRRVGIREGRMRDVAPLSMYFPMDRPIIYGLDTPHHCYLAVTLSSLTDVVSRPVRCQLEIRRLTCWSRISCIHHSILTASALLIFRHSSYCPRNAQEMDTRIMDYVSAASCKLTYLITESLELYCARAGGALSLMCFENAITLDREVEILRLVAVSCITLAHL